MPCSRQRATAFEPVYQRSGTYDRAPSSLRLSSLAYVPSFVDAGDALADGRADGAGVAEGDADAAVPGVGLALPGAALVVAGVGGAEVGAVSAAGPPQPANASTASTANPEPIRSGTKQPPLRMRVSLP